MPEYPARTLAAVVDLALLYQRIAKDEAERSPSGGQPSYGGSRRETPGRALPTADLQPAAPPRREMNRGG